MAKFTIHPPQGGPVTVEAPSQEAALDQVLNASGGPDVSSLGSFGRGAAGMIPLGEQAYAGVAGLAEHKPYLQERQELNQEIGADEEQNPGARLAGQAAGVVAPIVATAGLAAPESLLGAAGQGALFGGAYGAGNAIDTLASGGSGTQAAGDVALGAGTGAAGGALGHGAGALLGKLAKPLLPTSDDIMEHATAGVFGGSPRQIRNLPGEDPGVALRKIMKTAQGSMVDGEPLIGMGDTMSKRLQKTISLSNSSGKTIGDAIENAGVEPIPAQDVINAIANGANKIQSPEEVAQMKLLPDMIKQYAGDDGSLSFAKLHALKGDIGDKAFSGQESNALKNAYHTVSDMQTATMDKAGISNLPEFAKAKEQYAMTSRVLPMLKMTVSKELANKASLTVPGAALLTGHPIIAGGALMKPRLEQIANGGMFKLAGNLPAGTGNAFAKLPSMGGAMAASSQIPDNRATTDINLQHPAMAPWREVFQKNAARAKDQGEIEKAHAVTDFTLSQRDPAYAKAKQTATDTPHAGNEPQKMAEGGLVSNSPDALGNLKGLQQTANEIAKPTVPMEPSAPVRTAAPKDELHQPFNSQFEDQLKAYLLKSKDRSDAQ